MVATLLSTHHWIWKLSLPLIQYTKLKHSSKIFLYSFSGQHCLALAVPQMATFITLAPERTLDKVKRLSIIATYHLDSFRGSFPSNNKTESIVFLPSTLPVHAPVATNLEGPQEIDEIDIPQVGVDGTASNGVEEAQSSDDFVNIPPAELSKLKVCELKAELSKHGQSINGLNAVLLNCLKNALEQHLPVPSSASQAAHLTGDITGFSANAQWKLLEPIETVVEEPQNVVPMTAPTIPIIEAAFVPQKHNFSQIFDHAPFMGLEKFQNIIVVVGQLFMMVSLYLKRRLMSREDQKLIFVEVWVG